MSRRVIHTPATATTETEVVRLKPYQYIHVHDNNANVTRVELGPCTFTKQDHEQILTAPLQCIVVPPRHYCVIENPVLRDKDGKIQTDKHGQARVRLGDREIRFESEPFPLYPQEVLFKDEVLPLKVLPVNRALKLKALRDFDDKVAGDEWLFEGPATFIPRVEVDVVEERAATIIKPNTALLLKARNNCTDRLGQHHNAGEEWLHMGVGSYLPGVEEDIVRIVEGKILTETKALHLEALRDFTDIFGTPRRAGEQWLITAETCETYVVGPNEKFLEEVRLTVLTDRQFCVVVDPWRDGKQLLGQKEVRRGRTAFFLHPGETLERGIQDVFVLSADEALLLAAKEFTTMTLDGAEKVFNPGDKWMIYGPREYVPQVSVEVVEKRHNIALGDNEGIYVRDTKTGQVRAVIGKTYMLLPDEELWAKPLSDIVLEKLALQGDLKAYWDKSKSKPIRDPTRVVTYSVPHNSVVQVYDYKSKRARIVFGPEMVKLGPDEEFTLLSLSGDKPKRPGVINTLCLCLGPDFMTDILTVETLDHARLSLQLSYSWRFDCPYGDKDTAAKVFNVADFVGDACNAIASRIRGAVAAVPFDAFHKSSSAIIKFAVFGEEPNTTPKRPRDFLRFKNNNLIITSVDIQSVEPVDAKTRDALMKSVQLAIEITTKSQEASARHDAETREQKAKGELERQIIDDKAKAEKERLRLLELQAESAAIESTGASKAEAKATAAAAEIEGQSAVDQARLRAEAQSIASEADLQSTLARQVSELEFKQKMNGLEVEKTKQLAEIEVKKFKQSVESIGKGTIAAMARAGPEMQAKLLRGLGLQGYMLTDGNSPINLFNAANSLTGSA